MTHNREFSEKPLVSLEAGKLLGMRQVAKVSAERADGELRDPGGTAEARAKTSRLLSKIGEVPSDVRAKHNILLLGHLDNGLGFYRFSYNGSDDAYVGVMAQEVQAVMPKAVVRGDDGYLRVNYDRLGLRMQSWEDWIASGAKIPTTAASLRQ